MNTTLRALPLLALAGLVVPAVRGAAAQGAPQDPVYERVGEDWYRVERGVRYRVDPRIVSVRLAAPLASLGDLQRAVATRPEAGLVAGLTTLRTNRLGVHDVEVPEGADVLAVVAALRASGLVDFAEENTIGEYVADPDDPQFGQQWGLKNTGQSGGTPDADIDADLAWDLTTGDPGVVIAVLDSGTEITHPDLADNTWVNTGEIQGNGVDDDGNGYVDDVFGWDFSNGNNSVPGPFFHGTFVTGIVSARTNNAVGVAGVAGGFLGGDGCLTMACGVGDLAPNGAILDEAILYAADNGARVITLSLTVGSSAAIDAALDYARNTRGVFVDCAAGNGPTPVTYPANNPNVAAIAATTRNDQRAGFSNTGPELWVAAPGADIRSTDTGGGYTNSDGTSFAAPHVAGTVGLLLAAAPNLAISPAGLENVLKVSAQDLPPAGFDSFTGWGRINAHDAVLHILAGDCNGNGVYDYDDVLAGTSQDVNGNGVPDECECIAESVNYCASSPNSIGPGAMLYSTGSSSVAANDLALHAYGLPVGQFALFVYGASETSVPLFEGTRCVALPFVRLPLMTSDVLGFVSHFLDIGSPPQPSGQITSGSTWSFQLFYRDPAGGGTRANLSDGLRVTFCD